YPAPRPISLPRSRGACGRLRGVTGLEVVARRDQDDLGPSPRTCSTCCNAALRSDNQESSCSPTSLTHQASASLRLRATPASTKVSSTVRSFWRSLVITGTENVVYITVRSPERTPHETLRPNVCSASCAISIRCCLVSSRN